MKRNEGICVSGPFIEKNIILGTGDLCLFDGHLINAQARVLQRAERAMLFLVFETYTR